ncbi:iron-containing alcohol dehydrogenase [uncultured Muribaculum sp.]|uniref:iron-containing alcohol dehydrogenase n=1 Tax=uncultured Muribaculum sp. TaxID=1918613 RepID=UPI0025E53221|nr:iron-containing alcohol dehydrogenase [uncultured Muribaculum sp.]
MDNFVYYAPTKFVFGRYTERRAGELAREFGGTRALVVFGGGSAVRSGAVGRTVRSLHAAGLDTFNFEGITPNPTDDKVREGIDIVRRNNIDIIVAVGGGSVIDTAKAIALGVPYDGDFWDFYCGKLVPEHALPVGVVLTIPAAGSEGSGNSVITRMPDYGETDKEGNPVGPVKLSLRTESVLRPKFSIMNPEFTMTLPAWQTACGIVDMMAHIFERYFSNTPDCEVTDRVAEGLLKAIITEGRRVMDSPDDYQARANIMWAATLAHNGLCGTGRREDWSSHFIEHEISAVYPEVAHGAGLAAVVPAWMEYVAEKNPGKVAQFARRVMDVPVHEQDADDDELSLLDAGIRVHRTLSTGEIAAEGIRRLREFYRSLGMPSDFAGMGIASPDVTSLVEALHLHKGQSIGNYVELTSRDTKKIYNKLL